jgi:hypothetical protein
MTSCHVVARQSNSSTAVPCRARDGYHLVLKLRLSQITSAARRGTITPTIRLASARARQQLVPAAKWYETRTAELLLGSK